MLRLEALDAAWEEKLVRLEAYKAVHGDCSVPQRWAEDKQLGNWVCQQRRVKQKLDRGEPSKGMTAERVARLTALGLVWDPGKAQCRQPGMAQDTCAGDIGKNFQHIHAQTGGKANALKNDSINIVKT
jgi:hypothetical protein